MFSAVARIERGPVELTVGMAFERRFRIFAINRRGIVFDTRFAPPIKAESGAIIVYLLLEGTLRWSDGVELVGPSLFVMRESDFEGAMGSRGRVFRSWGTPFRTVELRVQPADCAAEVAAVPAALPLDGPDDPLVAAGRLYLHASHAKKGQTVIADLAASYLRELERRGVLAADLASSIVHDEGVRGALWDAMRPMVETFGADARQDELVARVGWGARRVQRELTRIAVSHGVEWIGGWRDVVLRYRVRVAVLLLSSPALSVSEVADAVGYGSVEAFAHALDACGLPSATEIRRRLLGEASAD
ncbi:MAG: helix-turn-helix transcriptional regulator [Myxococcales bacterium]|jgi:AraC-like DNA-binding protein|nr:helix-turn-helix transcriptional regulator [Myxococcales bacterium]